MRHFPHVWATSRELRVRIDHRLKRAPHPRAEPFARTLLPSCILGSVCRLRVCKTGFRVRFCSVERKHWLPVPASGPEPRLLFCLRRAGAQLEPTVGGRARAVGVVPSSRVSGGYLVDPASSHMLVSKTKPCMSKYKRFCTVKLRMAH